MSCFVFYSMKRRIKISMLCRWLFSMMFSIIMLIDESVNGGNMTSESIGKFMCELRKEIGMTQKEMANKLGVSDKTISKWETGVSQT